MKDAKAEERSLARDYARYGDNDALQNFASRIRPVLRDHQRMLDDLERNIRRSDRVSRRDGFEGNAIEPSAGGEINHSWDRSYHVPWGPDRRY